MIEPRFLSLHEEFKNHPNIFYYLTENSATEKTEHVQFLIHQFEVKETMDQIPLCLLKEMFQ